MLPVQVSAEFLDAIFKAIEADPETQIEVNLPEERITILSSGASEAFTINSYKKENMLNGFDDIDYLLNMGDEITEFATKTPL